MIFLVMHKLTAQKVALVDIFSGSGLASLGFTMSGFRIAAALEIDPRRCDVYEKNFHLRPIEKDVMKVTGREILKKAGLKKGSRFCVVGCPPCQSFSKLSDTRRVDTLRDPRSRFVEKFAELIIEMMPAAVVFENVWWMAHGPGRKFFVCYLETLEKNGYHTKHGIVNARDFGVPQSRRRVVAVSIRKELLDKGRLGRLDDFYKSKTKRPKTVREAISGLVPLESGQRDATDPLHFASAHREKALEIIRHVPKNGGSRKELPKELWLDCHKRLQNGGAETSYGRMWWDKPAPTLTRRCTVPACGRFTHPEQNRGITLREAARLQTIPDDFDFDNKPVGSIEAMIGDGVPVDLARHVGELLKTILI